MKEINAYVERNKFIRYIHCMLLCKTLVLHLVQRFLNWGPWSFMSSKEGFVEIRCLENGFPRLKKNPGIIWVTFVTLFFAENS